MKKVTVGNWPSLQHDGSATATVRTAVVPASTRAAAEQKHLASFEKNWDSIAKVTGALDDPKPEGDEALNALFKQVSERQWRV
jgi:hypothetical protein